MSDGILKFEGYTVEKLEYHRHRNYSEIETEKIIPQFMFKLIISRDTPNKANLILGVKLGEKKSPFVCEAIIKGYFEFIPQDDISHNPTEFYLQNGAAILYPYIRSLITTLTSTGAYKPVILPTINFYNFISQYKIEDILADSKYYESYECNN